MLANNKLFENCLDINAVVYITTQLKDFIKLILHLEHDVELKKGRQMTNTMKKKIYHNFGNLI